MRTEIQIRQDGMLALLKNLGDLDAERFVVMMQKETLDYTEWRRSQFSHATLEELSTKAMQYYEQQNKADQQ